jgi:CheY-like chemotaxis protein
MRPQVLGRRDEALVPWPCAYDAAEAWHRRDAVRTIPSVEEPHSPEARVLVVDDDADIRLLLRHLLATAGMAVDEAAGGPEALALLDGSRRWDAVVLDVQMPAVDGWDVLEAIRATPGVADLPVVMCTVKASPRDVLRAWDLGCDGYVTKPFDTSTLIAQLRAVIALDATARSARRADNRLRAEQRLHAAERA